MKVSSDRDFPAHLYIFIFVYFEYSEFLITSCIEL